MTENSGLNPSLTHGNYHDETLSAQAFDEYIEKSGLFINWGKHTRQGICGELIHPLPGLNNKSRYLIDRILVPSSKIKEAGWTKGLIGVELKKSGIKVGPPLSQMLDYLRCAWLSPHNVKVLLDYCFLWPLDKCGGATASIMAQNHIGGVFVKYPPDSEYHRLQFFIGEQAIIEHYYNKDRTEVKNLETGNKTGSR